MISLSQQVPLGLLLNHHEQKRVHFCETLWKIPRNRCGSLSLLTMFDSLPSCSYMSRSSPQLLSASDEARPTFPSLFDEHLFLERARTSTQRALVWNLISKVQ